MLRVGFFEPDERLLLVAHAGVGYNEGCGIDLMTLVHLFQLPEGTPSLARLARAAVGVGQRRPNPRLITRKAADCSRYQLMPPRIVPFPLLHRPRIRERP